MNSTTNYDASIENSAEASSPAGNSSSNALTSNLANNTVNNLDYSVNLPEKYNTYDSLGTNVKQMFVRDQGNSSTCWAFAANTLFELSLAAQHKIYLDFSEDHLILNTPIKVDYNTGGNIDVATAYYNNWRGPVVDPNDRFGDGQTDNMLKPEYIISDFIEIENDLEKIKYAVYEFGAVQSSIGYDENKDYYDEETYGFFNYETDSRPSHDIVIVGWDDEFSKDNFKQSPTSDGAFMVQNSWGREWGDDGVFFVSYEDAHILTKATAITSIVKSKDNQKQYYYNSTGITHFEGYTDFYKATGLNVFTSSPKTESTTEYLTSVGFYTNSLDVKFKVSFANASVPESSYLDMKEIASGTASLPGYHTVTLTNPIKLEPEKPFSIAVTFENEDTIFLVPLEAPIPNIPYFVTCNLN